MAKKLNIPYMQKIYQQTLSLSATAKACGCQLATVRKYRDKNKWATPEEIEEASKGGRDITLTADIAVRLATGWRRRMIDKDLCYIVGISEGQLRGWLQLNTVVTIIYNVKQPDGKEYKRSETIGLRDLKEKEYANCEFNFYQRQDLYREEAYKAKQYGLAAGIDQWNAEHGRMFKIFSNKDKIEINNNTVNQQNNYIKIETLNLDLETRKKILSAIKERELIEQENVKELE